MASVNDIGGALTTAQLEYLDRLKKEADQSDLVKNQKMDKDAFLRILTTQLKYQDPLNPTTDKEFIGQMAQFSALEQTNNMANTMTKQNKTTEMMLEMMTKLNANIEKLLGNKGSITNTNADDKTDIAKELAKISETNSKILSELINLNKVKNYTE